MLEAFDNVFKGLLLIGTQHTTRYNQLASLEITGPVEVSLSQLRVTDGGNRDFTILDQLMLGMFRELTSVNEDTPGKVGTVRCVGKGINLPLGDVLFTAKEFTLDSSKRYVYFIICPPPERLLFKLEV